MQDDSFKFTIIQVLFNIMTVLLLHLIISRRRRYCDINDVIKRLYE